MAFAWIQAGPAIHVIVDGSPGQRGLSASDVAVNQVADAPERLRAGREERGGVEHDKGIDAHTQGAPEQDWHHGKDRAKESHTAFPGRQDTPGLFQVARHQIRLLDDEIETPANQAAYNTPPEYPIDLILANTFPLGILANQPEAHRDGHSIHQAIPAQRQRTDMHDDRVNVDMNIRTNTQPSPI